MKKMCLLLALFCCVFASRISAQPVESGGTLSGVVVNQDGNPLRKARVTVRREQKEGSAAFWGGETLTDAKGQFAFPSVDAGTYSVWASAKGYYGHGQGEVLFEFKPGKSLMLMLSPQARIPIRFLAANGTAIRNTLIEWNLYPLARGSSSNGVAKTNADGIVIFESIDPADYRLEITASGHGYGLLPRFTLKSGRNLQQEMQLEPSGALHVSAVEQNPDGTQKRTLGGGTVMLYKVNENNSGVPASGVPTFSVARSASYAGVTSDVNGISQFTDLPAGRYEVQIPQLFSQQLAPRRIEIKLGETTELDFIFAPLRGTSLTIEARNAQGLPLASTELRLFSARDTAADPLIPIGDPASERRFRTDAHGRATLYPFAPGLWRVWLEDTQLPNLKVPTEGAVLSATMP